MAVLRNHVETSPKAPSKGTILGPLQVVGMIPTLILLNMIILQLIAAIHPKPSTIAAPFYLVEKRKVHIVPPPLAPQQ